MDKNAIQITLRNGEKINLLKDSKVLVKNKGIINCSEISVGDIIYNTALPNTEKETPYILTDGILWLIGLYLAEGSHSDDCIQLSLNSDEFCWYQKISDTIKQLDGSCTYSINGNSLSIRIHSCIFNSILKKYLCGEIAKNKHLSNSCWQLNNHCLEQILMGYLDGDGCNRKIYSNGSRYRLSFTFNQPLSQDIRILSSRLGFHLVLQKKHIQYNNKKHSIFYGELVIPNEHFRKCKERFEIIKVQESNCTSFYELIIDSDQLIMPSGYSIVAENIKDKKIICEENK